MRARLLLVVLGLLLFWSRSARAERDLIVPFEEGGHLVLDQLSGMRVNAVTGVGYAGPIGLAFHDDKADSFTPGTAGDETKTTTVWLAPSADYFVTDHLSLGGMIEVAHTWGSVESAGQRVQLPGTTSLTFLPRVGFYVPISDRIGIWPRAGFGWTSTETASYVSTGSAVQTDKFKAMLLDVDLGFVYRFQETFFLKAGPEISTTLGGDHTVASSGVSQGASGSTLRISGVIGFGMNIEL